MFCSTCGAALTKGLSYCNRCGAKTALSINPLAPSGPPDKLAEIVMGLSVVSGVVVLGGFFFVYLLVTKLLDRLINPSAIIVFMIFSLAAVFGISWLLIRQLTRTLDVYLRADKKEKQQQLAAPDTPQLAAPREPIPSVTENTTRAFEPSLRERGN